MKISIHADGRRIWLAFPNCFLINGYVLNGHSKVAKRLIRTSSDGAENLPTSLRLTHKDARRARKIIRKTRRMHPDWLLVDVNSADGTGVQIRL